VAGDLDKGPDPSAELLDRQVDALMGRDGVSTPARTAPPARGEITAAGAEPRVDAQARGANVAKAVEQPVDPSAHSARHDPESEPLIRGLEERGSDRRVGARYVALFVALFVALALGVGLLRPDAVSRLLGGTPEDRALGAERALEQEQRAVAEARRTGDLIVDVGPGDVEVFRYVGDGPVELPRVPVGVRQEFVALAEGGYARAALQADAPWAEGPGGKRYELALQADGRPQPGEGALGVARAATAEDQPTDVHGVVRVVTAPMGARVYHRLGVGARVELRGVDIARPIELLAYRTGYAVKRISIAPADFSDEGGGRVARLELLLDAME
jgi:hypothetical protein